MQFSLLSASTIAALGFTLAALGIMVQILAGVVSTKVPAGAAILLVIAVFTIVKSWRWMPGVGVIACLLIMIGAFVAGGLGERLTRAGQTGPFVGTVIQLCGIGIGIVAGIIAIA